MEKADYAELRRDKCESIAMDGLHAVSFAGVAPVQTWLPDFSTSGAVKKGEVEMNAAIALKASKAAGVFRNIKVK